MAATAIPIPNSGEVVASSWGAAVAGAHNGIQSGTVPVTVSGAVSGFAAVVFPRPFSAPPVVIVAIGQLGAVATTRYYALAGSITALGFNAYVQHADNTSGTAAAQNVSWIAIGLP